MHIPDGFLDAKTYLTAAGLSMGTLTYGFWRIKEKLNDRRVPLMGVMGAFIFAAQMINFPVMVGTSGHLIGAALAAIVLGPWTASIIMTTILFIQWLLMNDGGFTALGANILNMALLASFIAHFVYNICRRLGTGMIISSFAAAWLSVMSAALLAGLELAWSGMAPLEMLLPALGFWHLLIGLGEGLITASIITYLNNVRPELVDDKLKV